MANGESHLDGLFAGLAVALLIGGYIWTSDVQDQRQAEYVAPLLCSSGVVVNLGPGGGPEQCMLKYPTQIGYTWKPLHRTDPSELVVAYVFWLRAAPATEMTARQAGHYRASSTTLSEHTAERKSDSPRTTIPQPMPPSNPVP
jgi:hypothetical protein